VRNTKRLKFGPAPRQLLPIQTALQKEGAAVLQERWPIHSDAKTACCVAAAGPIEVHGQEIKLVDEVIEVMRQFNAVEASALSHLEKGWQIAKEGEDIPYGWVFCRRTR